MPRADSRGCVTGARLELQLRSVERAICVTSPRSSRPAYRVDLLSADAETLLQAVGIEGEIVGDTSSRTTIAEAAAAQLDAPRLEQVVGLVRDGQVGVARDPERRVLDHLHAREQPGQEVRDHVLEREQDVVLSDLQEARQRLRHLHAREALLVGRRVAHEDAEAERERRDEREGLAGPTASGVSTGRHRA